MLHTLELINKQRTNAGFLAVDEELALCERGNVIFDPYSLLISNSVSIGEGNIFYPGVIIELRGEGELVIGNDNVFYSGTYFLAEGGAIIIGNKNQFGDGGIALKANRPDSRITIGDYGRYLNGPEVVGRCELGSGSQIIGRITVQNCYLSGGEPYTNSDPDLRGAILKGFGTASSVVLKKGEALQGFGNFDISNIKQQSFYHPKKG